MKEETVISQQAQNQSSFRSFVATLSGQNIPAFIRFPVLNENSDEPSQSERPYNISSGSLMTCFSSISDCHTPL